MNGIAELYRLRLAETIAAGDTTPIMAFPIGNWHSAKYPDLPLTEDLAHEIIANFEAGVLGREPVVDSSGKHDTSAPAAGWVKRVYLASYEEGDVTGLALWADVQWTTLGAQLLNDGLYQYDSVEIRPVVMNESGDEIPNVLCSFTLTNTPVLSIMPGVKNAAEKQRIAVTLSLSEVKLTAAPVDPVQSILDDMDALAAKADASMKGKKGMPDMRAMMRQARAKVSAHSLTEDPGDHAEPIDGSSDAASQPAKADEGQDVVLADGDAATKGSDPMKTVATKLNLAEDAPEALVLAEVVKLAEHDAAETKRADEAEVKLAETEKTGAIAAFTIKLDEKIKTENTIAPGQRDYFLGLADRNMVEAELALASHTVKVIDVAERGSGTEGDDKPTKRADVELSELTRARMVKDGIGYPKAMGLTLAENPNEIRERYQNFLDGKEG